MPKKVTAEQIEAAKAAGLREVEALAAACEKHDLRFYLGCTILQKESGGKNIYGHDPGGVFNVPGEKEVTEENFKEFLKLINSGKTSNGVGPMQITYKGHFPIMVSKGLKPWVPADNIDYGIGLIAADYRRYKSQGLSTEQAFQRAATIYNLGHWSETWQYGIDAVKRATDWQKKVGTSDYIAPEPTPTPVPEPVPVVPVVITKPDPGSKSVWVRVDASGNRVATGENLVTTRGLNMYLEACRLYRHFGGGTPPTITQGGRSNAVGASAGTHGREAFDWSTKNLDSQQSNLWELCCWIVGFASWKREALAGKNGWPRHDHGVPKGGDLSSEAVGQVTQFKNSRDGLAHKGPYPRIAKLGVGDWTWEKYLNSFTVDPTKLRTAIEKRTKSTQVLRLQWALSCLLRRDLAGDGDPGPITKAALASAGGLNLEKLMLPTSAIPAPPPPPIEVWPKMTDEKPAAKYWCKAATNGVDAKGAVRKKRAKDFAITTPDKIVIGGEKVPASEGNTKWLKTVAGYYYRLDQLTVTAPVQPKPEPKPEWSQKPTIILLTKDMPNPINYLQGVVRVGAMTATSGEKFDECYIMAQDPDKAGDTRFVKFYADGRYQSWMTVKNGGHGQTFHAYRSAAGNLYIWTYIGTTAYRIPWQSNMIVTTGEKSDYKGARPVGSYEPFVGWRKADSTKETFYLHNRFDFLAGKTTPLKQVTISKATNLTQQSWAVSETRIYRLLGKTNQEPGTGTKRHVLDVFDWNGKNLLNDFDLTKMSVKTTSDEPEGVTFDADGNLMVGKREGGSKPYRSYPIWTMKNLP